MLDYLSQRSETKTKWRSQNKDRIKSTRNAWEVKNRNSLSKRLTIIMGRIDYHSRKFNYESDIDKMYLSDLVNKQNGLCAITNKPMSLITGTNKSRNLDLMSLDRIDSSKGYVIGNVWLVRYIVNDMKRHYDLDLFVTVCRQVVDNT